MKDRSQLLQIPTNSHAVATALVLLACLITVVAQSGRRAPKSVPTPAATPESISSEKKPSEKEQPRLPLTVGIDSHDAFAFLPQYFYDSVLESCAERLSEARSIKIDVQRNMNRGEAVKRAKAEREANVVLLQLRTDSMGSSSANGDYSQVYIEYWVFAPTTAKVITSGNVYQQAYRTKGVIVPVPSGQTNTAYTELRLKQAAQEAADRILSALHLARPELPRSQQPLR